MPKMTRRQAMQTAGATAAALTLGPVAATTRAAEAQAPSGPFTLPKLPYAFNALEPHIDARTMEIHHDRHHQAYVTGLNTAVMGQKELQGQTVEQLLRNIAKVPQTVRQAVINHGGGHYNHSMFWEIMGPKAGGNPDGPVGQAINKAFGSFDALKKQFSAACATRFGSGWGWLVLNSKRQLEVLSSANQDCPLMEGKTPIMGLDVWEHAYYLHYQNRRPDYITAWWNVVNWNAINERFNRAMKS